MQEEDVVRLGFDIRSFKDLEFTIESYNPLINYIPPYICRNLPDNSVIYEENKSSIKELIANYGARENKYASVSQEIGNYVYLKKEEKTKLNNEINMITIKTALLRDAIKNYSEEIANKPWWRI